VSEQSIALVISINCIDCTPDEAVEEYRQFLSRFGTIPVGDSGEGEVLDVNLLFPRKADT
jgi:hypothetical protein